MSDGEFDVEETLAELRALPRPAMDMTTPEGAILCLEDAYRRRDIEAAVACKDFEVEAVLMLLKVDPDMAGDAAVVQEAAKTLELGFRKEREGNWPDLQDVEVFFVERERGFQELSIIVVTEVAYYPDGTFSKTRLQVSQREGQGWRVLVPLPEEDEKVTRHNLPVASAALPENTGVFAEAIAGHIQQYWGPTDVVFNDAADVEYAKIDVHLVKATEERPYHTLITSGMSDRQMTVPEGAEELALAELVISLPPDWPVDEASLADERYGWPLTLLKQIARFPHEYGTWLYMGHTVPNTESFLPYTNGTKLCSLILAPPALTEEGSEELEVDKTTKILFHSLILIFREEWDFTVEQKSGDLIQALWDADITELVDLKRKTIC